MSRSTQIPVYATGTIAIAAQSGGVYPVTGVSTVWTSPDGVTNWSIAPGDVLICNAAWGFIGAVNSNTSISLATWSGGVVSAGATYYIFRYSGQPTSAIGGLVTALLALGSTLNPFAALSAYTNNGGTVGAGKINLGDDGAGNALLQIRPSSGSDSAYVSALKINETTGVVTGVNGGGLVKADTTATISSTSSAMSSGTTPYRTASSHGMWPSFTAW